MLLKIIAVLIILISFAGSLNAVEISSNELAEWTSYITNCDVVYDQYKICSNQLQLYDDREVKITRKHYIIEGLLGILLIIAIIL